MGTHPKSRLTVVFVAVLAATSGAGLALPSSAPAAAPPAAIAEPALLGPAALPLVSAIAAALWAEALAASACPIPGTIDAGERDPLPRPIPEMTGGGDDPSGPWPVR